LKYFIPEWNDRVDPEYDFLRDSHSAGHKECPASNDVYIWEIFGINNVPVDGVLVSRITIANDKKKYRQTIEEGIHKVLRLPQNFKILGDCGAFGYVREKMPPFDPVEILRYYKDLGFNYGVSVDHLVVPQFEAERQDRMRTTYANGVKAFDEWSKKFRDEFTLLLAVQGWDVPDYLRMYNNYVNLGACHFAFGGLARCPTVFIRKLIDELVKEIKNSKKIPSYLHFLGLARPLLFTKFEELEDLGVDVGFDSSSFLRKAWLSSPTSELNYVSTERRGYTAIRIPFVSRKREQEAKRRKSEHNQTESTYLEQECLTQLRLYDKGNININSVLSVLSDFSKSIGESPDLIKLYHRTLADQPWKRCDCPICKRIGVEVIIFRGNNRNRRRGFHNTYVFYKILKNRQLWNVFVNKQDKKNEVDLSFMKKGDKILVITGCTKEKLGYTSSVKLPARIMYQGRLFKSVKAYAEAMGFDYLVISAKYGLVYPNDIIEGYEKALKTKEDVRNLRPLVEDKLKRLLVNYDRIIVISGQKYRDVLQNVWDDRFVSVRGKGYGDLCRIIRSSTPESVTLSEFVQHGLKAE
jgi:hypothetical protein